MGTPDDSGERRCPSCGEPLGRGSDVCPNCGATTAEDRPSTGLPGSESPVDARSEPRSDDGSSARSSRQQEDRSPRGASRPGPDRGGSGPRVGAESIGPPRDDEPAYRTIGVAIGIGILGILLLGIISVVGALLFFAVALVLGFDTSEILLFVAATAIGQYVGFVGLALLYLRNRGYDWSTVRAYLGLRKPTLREYAVVFLGYVALFALLLVVSIVASLFLPEPAENEGAQMLAETPNPAVIAGAVAFMFLVVGPCEELLFRGVVQNRLRERFSAVPAIVAASAIFAAIHVAALAGDPTAMAVTIGILFVPALVLGAVYEYTGNIVVPSLLHSIHNSVLLLIVFFASGLEENAAVVSWLATALPF